MSVRYAAPSYPDDRAWMGAALGALEAELFPIVATLMEVLG